MLNFTHYFLPFAFFIVGAVGIYGILKELVDELESERPEDMKDVYIDDAALTPKKKADIVNKLSGLYPGSVKAIRKAGDSLFYTPIFHYVSPEELRDIQKLVAPSGVKLKVVDAASKYSTVSAIPCYGVSNQTMGAKAVGVLLSLLLPIGFLIAGFCLL